MPLFHFEESFILDLTHSTHTTATNDVSSCATLPSSMEFLLFYSFYYINSLCRNHSALACTCGRASQGHHRIQNLQHRNRQRLQQQVPQPKACEEPRKECGNGCLPPWHVFPLSLLPLPEMRTRAARLLSASQTTLGPSLTITDRLILCQLHNTHSWLSLGNMIVPLGRAL